MFKALALFTADAHLGRVDIASLPQHTCMEMLVDLIPEKGAFQNKEGAYRDIKTWIGVRLNYDSEVTQIAWAGFRGSGFFKGGHIQLDFLPGTLIDFACERSKLTGTLDTGRLPRVMRRLSLSGNQLSGTLDMPSLPRHMETFKVSSNQFSGSIDLRDLPETIRYIMLFNNLLTGNAVAENLPDGLERIRLYGNAITHLVDGKGKALEDERVVLVKDEIKVLVVK